MTTQQILGYADPWSVKAGETVSFMVSGIGVDTVDAKLVRLIHGDENPEGPGFVEEEIESGLPSVLNVRHQYPPIGAHAVVADPDQRLAPEGDLTLYAFVCVTKPGPCRQVILGKWDETAAKGYALGLDKSGYLEFWVGDGKNGDRVTAPVPLMRKAWYLVAVRYDAASRRVQLTQIGVVNRYNSLIGPVAAIDYDAEAAKILVAKAGDPGAAVPFLWAGASLDTPQRGRHTGLHYNGKIDRAGVVAGLLPDEALLALAKTGTLPADAGVIACWDTTVGYTDRGIGDIIVDTGPHGLHATGVNRPVRAMTGWNWQGRADSFRLDPSQYGGIVFHEDALTDCRWQPTVHLTVPADTRSGVYALRLRSGEVEDHIPFFVRAANPKAPLAMLMSTFTYLAYANECLTFDAPIVQAITAQTPILTDADLSFSPNREYGISTYDHHVDGAGCCYTSWRRPILNIRPRHRMSAMNFPWALPADLSLIWWLENSGLEYEIVTDHDLHAEGVEALAPYRAVITSTHPEYYSERMLDGTEDYLVQGGRLVYAGGNGYYWVCGLRDDKAEAHCMEVRKLDNGSRAWQADPGEGYLATTGERSGLWRSRGRAPQKIVGVGFTSEGMDESRPFERMPDSFDPKVAWMFEGIGAEEPIGDGGLGAGGAAGIEIDRYELALGTPPSTLLLAASFDHTDGYPLVSEEIGYSFPGRGGTQDPQVRADMIFFETPGDGACLATGSIAWSQALPWRNGDNTASRFMRNVLTAFAKPGPLPKG
jgi:N,N-dimethylformamidase